MTTKNSYLFTMIDELKREIRYSQDNRALLVSTIEQIEDKIVELKNLLNQLDDIEKKP